MHKRLERLHPYFIEMVAHRGWLTSQLSPAPSFRYKMPTKLAVSGVLKGFRNKWVVITS